MVDCLTLHVLYQTREYSILMLDARSLVDTRVKDQLFLGQQVYSDAISCIRRL